MKKSLLLFLIVLFGGMSAYAQTPPFMNGTSASPSNSFPWNTVAGKGVQTFCPAGIFSGAFIGQIDTLWFNVSANQTSSWTNLVIKLQQNVPGLATGMLTPGGTTVFSAAAYTGSSNAQGWMPIALTTPFLFDPTKTLIVNVGVCSETGSGSMSTSNISISPTLGRTWSDYPSCIQTYAGQDNNMSWLGLSLSSPLSCSTPTNGSATFISQDSVSLSWTDNNSPAATTWQIEYGPGGFTATGNPQITTTTNPHGIGGLMQNTTYDFYVRAYCGSNDSSYYHSILGVTTLASCPFPSNLTATNITASSADLNWTENGSATTWGIEIGLSGFTPTGNATFQTTMKPFNLPGLPDNTCFDYYVQADCGPDSSVFIGPYTFCTLVAPLSCSGSAAASVIFTEGFDLGTYNTQYTANGWTNTRGSSVPDWSRGGPGTPSSGTGPNSPQAGAGFMFLETSTSTIASDTLISPTINLTGIVGAARAKFFYHMYGQANTSAMGRLSMCVDNGTSITELWSDSGIVHPNQSDPWDSAIVNLNAYVGQSIKILFVGNKTVSGTQYGDMSIDELSVEACVACAAPANLVASNITNSQADISWSQNGVPLNWHLEVVPAGTTPTGIPTDTASTNPYTLTGLTLLQPVDIYVRANCDTNGVSSYVGPLTILPCSPLAGNYTINASLPPSATNFQSFGAVDTALQCGVNAPVVFSVDSASGPYIEQVEFGEVMGASSTNTITFNGNGATITAATTSTDYAVIRLNGSDFFRFKNLNVVSTGTSNAFAMHLLNDVNGTNNNHFTNCRFEVDSNATSSLVAAFVCSGSLTSSTAGALTKADSNIIDSCRMIGGYVGVSMYGKSSAPYSNGNQIKNCKIENFYVYGLYTAYQDDLLFSGNDLSRPTRTALSTCYAVYNTGLAERNLFEKNYVHDIATAAPTSSFTAYLFYMLQDASSVANSSVVQNNIIVNDGGSGTHYGIYLNNANNIKVYHNTVSFQATAAVSGTNRGIMQGGTTAPGQDIQNNIVSMTSTNSGAAHGIYLQANPITCDYNDVFGSMTNYNFGYNGANQANLAAWQASTPNVGDSSLELNPILSFNFIPGNILIDAKGNTLGVLDDIYGNSRSATTPDMGAVEFIVTCPAPSNIAASNVTANSLNLSWQENGTATLWDIEVKPTGTTPTGIPDSVGVTTNINFPITGLVPYTSYDFYVRASCGGTNGNSVFNGPFTVLVCAPLAGNYTINAGAAASATNFQSFTAAATALSCGISAPVVIDVVATSGPYNEQVIFPEVSGASSTNTITINGNGETITFATASPNYAVVKLDGSDWFRINDLNVVNTSASAAFGMHLVNVANPTNNNIIKRCSFETNTTVANSTICPFTMSGSLTSATTAAQVKADSNIIDSCTFIGGYYGVAMYGNTSLPYANGNQLTNCTIQDFYNYGLYSLYQDNFLVSGNDISRPTRTASTTCYGLYHSGLADNQLWEKNYIHNMFGGGPTLTSTAYYIYMLQDASSIANSNIVQNNLVDDSNGHGTHYLIYLNTANNIKVYHNTLLMNVVGGSGTQRGIMQGGNVGQDVQNNIIVNGSTGTGTKHGIYTTSNPLICDYNNVYISSTTGTNYYGYNGGNQLTLANWQSSTPTVGQNSSDLDPVFMQPSPNYTPANPLLNGTANAVGVLEDFYSSPRSATNPDMGAFEFSVAATDIAISSILSPDTTLGCYTANDTVIVQLTNAGSTPHDFVTNPTTVIVQVTGATTATLTAIVNTGTLPTFGTTSVTLSPLVNMTAQGTYTFNSVASTVGDVVLSNDTLAPYVYNVNLSAGTLSADPDVHCVSGVSTISLAGSKGGTIQWQSAASATGPWTNVGTGGTSYTTPTLTTTTYYRAYSVCNTNSDTTNVDTIIVNNPQITSTTSDTVCGPNSATLSATLFPGSGSTINWYDAPTGGTKLDTGSVFATPVISVTDTFYAVGSAGAGASDSVQLSNASQYTSTTRGYHFVSPIDFTITKLFVPTTYSSAAMNIVVMKFPTTPPTFAASTTTYQVLYSTFGNTNTGWIPVNIPIFAGDTIGILGDRATNAVNQYSSDQNIVVDGITIPIFRLIYQGALGTAATSMPVPVSDNGTGSKGSVDFQYAIGCEGDPRTPVVAVVNPSSGNLALATSSNASSNTGIDSLNDLQLDGQTLSYYNPSCELIATVDDAIGGNVLGAVTSKVIVDATVSVWNGQPYARRWYNIDVQNNGPATVTLYYTQDDFDDYNAHPSVISSLHDSLPTGPSSPTANIRITQISGGGLGVGTVTGVITPTTVWNATSMRWEMTFPVTGFSQFFLHAANPNNAALSVSLSDFTVVKNGSVSDASWFTLMEENNSHFNVQRSLDGLDFVTLGKVNSKAPNGTSTTKLAYAFTDYEPQIGHNYYRLEQVDLDGQKSYSGIVDLVRGADGSVVSIYPNPATDKLNVDVAIDKVTQMEVRLLDMSGRVVKSAVRRTVKGMNNVTLDLSDVAAGVYGIQVYDNTTLIHSNKVNKQIR